MVAFDTKFWRTIAANKEAMQEHAPEGYEAIVEVYLHGATGPIEVSEVQSPPGDVVLFQVHGDDSPKAHRKDKIVVTTPATVARVEVRYVQKSGIRIVGFRVTEDPFP